MSGFIFRARVARKGIRTTVRIGSKVSIGCIQATFGLHLSVMNVYFQMLYAAENKLGGVVDELNKHGPWSAYIDFDKYVRRKSAWARFFLGEYKVTRYRNVQVIGGRDIGYGIYGTRLDAINAIAEARVMLFQQP